MRNVLFVDDEPQILDGLRDALRKQRHEWNMQFCVSGEDALQSMSTTAFEVIVTDMRMPGMDGAELLRHVKSRHPSTIRIVLSGQADRELAMKMLPVSQQFLSKPCSTDRLRSVITHALELRDMLDDPVVLGLVGDVESLPSVPATYWQLTEALSSSDVGIAEISAIVEGDAGLSAKLLQIVNSAYFGLSQPVTSVSSAVNYVGIELLKALSLMVGIFSAAEHQIRIPEYSLEAAQRQALMVAQLARKIVTDRSRRDEAFTTGVLHDVGKLVLATRLPNRYGSVLREAAAGDIPLHLLEIERIGASHASVGGVLLGSWGLPCTIVQSVARHHAMTSNKCAEDPVTVAVHVADVMISSLLTGRADTEALDMHTLQQLDLLGSLREWRLSAEEIFQGQR